MSRGWAGGSTRRWRKIRAYVLARDGHVCQLRMPGCLGTATDAHHIDGRAYGDNPDRITAACGPCNRAVGEPLASDPKPTPRTNW